jgi:glutathione peroxidase-family protein
MMEKINVNGKGTHDVYKYLRANSALWDEKKKVAREIPWNFTKFLVSGDGKKIKFYHPRVNPVKIRPDIEKYLERVNRGGQMDISESAVEN